MYSRGRTTMSIISQALNKKTIAESTKSSKASVETKKISDSKDNFKCSYKTFTRNRIRKVGQQ